MISIMLHDLRWRVLLLGVVGVLFYMLEPAFHQHDHALEPLDASLSVAGVSATLSYLSGIAMIILLSGFISADRREGYTQIFFSHPTSPIAYFAARWLVALFVAVGAAAVFLLVGQIIAWGEVRGGAEGLILALLTALVYGSLMAFFSAVLNRGEGWVVFLLFLPTFFPQLLTLLQVGLPASIYRALLFVLPPHTAVQEVYQWLILEGFSWSPVIFILGYAAVWLLGAVAVVRFREWA